MVVGESSRYSVDQGAVAWRTQHSAFARPGLLEFRAIQLNDESRTNAASKVVPIGSAKCAMTHQHGAILAAAQRWANFTEEVLRIAVA